MEEKVITKIEDIVKGGVVELPPFYDGQPFVARLIRPSLISLCSKGILPNELLKEAQDIWDGKDMQPGRIKEYGEVLNKIAEMALVEPKYEDIKDYLTDQQLITIYNYTQMGVMSFVPFRKIEELIKDINSGKANKKGGKPNARHKK